MADQHDDGVAPDAEAPVTAPREAEEGPADDGVDLAEAPEEDPADDGVDLAEAPEEDPADDGVTAPREAEEDPADDGVTAPREAEEDPADDGAAEEVGVPTLDPRSGLRLRVRRRDLLIGLGVLAVLVAAGLLLARLLADDAPETVADRLAEAGPTDSFDRTSDLGGVGVATNGDSWNAVSGVWGIDSAQVALVQPAAGGARNLLTLDMGSEDGTIATTFARLRQGAGLVFRYAGPDDFWVLLPAPDFGTWVVQHLVDGEVASNQNIGLADSHDGVHVLLEVRRTTATVTIGDASPARVALDPSDATMVGFTTNGFGSNQARWDDFYALPD